MIHDRWTAETLRAIEQSYALEYALHGVFEGNPTEVRVYHPRPVAPDALHAR